MIPTLCSAIRSRHVIEFDYEGHHRIVNPHTVFDTKDGHTCLEAWQTGGTGLRTPPPDWGHFRLSKIRNLVITDASFAGPQPEYNPGRHANPHCHL
jgi:predicted DNA-binding transcriptional regulator YafY